MEITTKNMSDIFTKLDDLKNIFKFGEKTVPIIQSLIEFMREVVPLLDNINSSIEESTTQIPQATNQINSVTSATELATTEILNLVDHNSNCIREVDSKMKHQEQLQEFKLKLIREIKAEAGDNPALLEKLNRLEDSLNRNSFSYFTEILGKIEENNNQIMLSLQVQDITTQQLAAVTHLIESVHSKLASLVSDIDKADIEPNFDELKIEAPQNSHFNPEARYTDTTDKQKEIDGLVNDRQKKTSQDEVDMLINNQQQKTSQEEIDKLFS